MLVLGAKPAGFSSQCVYREVPPPEQSCGSRIRTDGLRGMSPAICHLIYPAMNIDKANDALP